MQFAVFSEDAIVYMGACPTEAAKAFGSKGGVKLETFSTAEELSQKFEAHKTKVESLSFEAEEFSEVFNKMLDKLDSLGINIENTEACVAGIQEQSEKIIGAVHHHGLQILKAAGNKFVWLGELLHDACEKEEAGKEK